MYLCPHLSTIESITDQMLSSVPFGSQLAFESKLVFGIGFRKIRFYSKKTVIRLKCGRSLKCFNGQNILEELGKHLLEFIVSNHSIKIFTNN